MDVFEKKKMFTMDVDVVFLSFCIRWKSFRIYIGVIKNHLQWNLWLFLNTPNLQSYICLFMQWMMLEISFLSFQHITFLSVFKPHFSKPIQIPICSMTASDHISLYWFFILWTFQDLGEKLSLFKLWFSIDFLLNAF